MIISIHQQTTSGTEKGASSADQDHIGTQEVSTIDITDETTVSRGTIQTTLLGEERTRPVMRSPGWSVDWSDAVDDQLMEEAVLQISGVGHWFLEGWIGDHSVDFLVVCG